LRHGRASLLLLLAFACRAPAEPSSASLEVAAVTSGPALDADGYRVSLDGEPSRRLEGNGTLLFSTLSEGEHEVELSNVAANCLVDGDSFRRVDLSVGHAARVEFSVECGSTFGTARVSATTIGTDPDPNGYDVLVDGGPMGVLAGRGLTELVLPAGAHLISLTGLTPNCQVQVPDQHSVIVPTAGTVSADFSVQCDAARPAGRGREIAFLTSRGQPDELDTRLMLMNADGTSMRPLLDSVHAVTWSPDGQRLAATNRLNTSRGALSIGELDADGRAAQFLDLLPALFLGGIAWSPAGNEIAYQALNPGEENDLRAISIDGGGDRPIAFAVAFDDDNPTWAPDGSTIAYSSSSGLRLVASDGSNDRPFLEPFSTATTPAWSPDGTRIAFAAVTDTTVGFFDSELDIFVVPVDGSGPSQLTRAPGDDGTPSWSPDGSQIAFVSHRDGNAEIYVMNSDGTGQVRITNDPGLDSLPSWRP
jgi:WD40 repeat protein